MPDQLTYVYVVGHRIPHEAVAGLRGIGDHLVRLVEDGDLGVVVGSVPAAEFSADEIDARLQDLGWITDTARAHHRVVDAIGARAVVAPFALATVYLDDGRVGRVLRERRSEFTAVLDRLRGRAEWGVKAWAAPQPSSYSGAGRATSGAEYLRRRRAALRESERGTDAAHDAADVLHAAAAEGSDAARRHRLHEPALSGRSEPMVLNGAYLVDDDRVAGWRAGVEGAATGSGLVVEVTGPWVPYSFVDRDTR